MRNRWVFIISLGGCVGLAFIFSFLVIQSWWGGPDGEVLFKFNLVGERLIETFLFPLWAIFGLWSLYMLVRFYDIHRGWK